MTGPRALDLGVECNEGPALKAERRLEGIEIVLRLVQNWGFVDLTKTQAKEIDERYLRASRKESMRDLPDAA